MFRNQRFWMCVASRKVYPGSCPCNNHPTFSSHSIARKARVSLKRKIIHIHNNILRGWRETFFSHSVCMWGIFGIILSVPWNIVMEMNNVMRLIRGVIIIIAANRIPTPMICLNSNISYFVGKVCKLKLVTKGTKMVTSKINNEHKPKLFIITLFNHLVSFADLGTCRGVELE